MNSCDMIVKNNIAELENISLALEKYFDENALPSPLLFEVNLVIEEIFTNIVFYAFNDDKEHLINIMVEKVNNAIKIIIEDSGLPFDPMTTPEPDFNKSLLDREIGGLGIHLIKKLMDQVEYHRLEGKNVLQMIKYFQPESTPV